MVDKCETREPVPSVRSTETIVRTSMTSVAKNEEMAGFRRKVGEGTWGSVDPDAAAQCLARDTHSHAHSRTHTRMHS